MGFIKWNVDLNTNALVVAEYEDWQLFVCLRIDERSEGFPPFFVTVEHDGDFIKDERFYTYEDAINFVHDFVNGKVE